MVDAHFTFEASAFADATEVRAQNVNGICGRELAAWLSLGLASRGLEASEPWAEDHGWDFSAAHGGATYLVACSIADEEPGTPEGHVAVAKSRSLKDKLLGRNAFAADDAVVAAIEAVLAGSPDVAKLVRE
jgi:hypothetical protein